MITQQVDVTKGTLRQQILNSKLTLLHPKSQYRPMVVTRLVDDGDLPTYYYAVRREDQSALAFANNIITTLATQAGVEATEVNEGDDVVAKLVDVLNNVDQDQYVIILDEFDQSDDAEDVPDFMALLLEHLPEKCRLFINSRTIPQLPWIPLIASGSATIVKDDAVVMQYINEKAGGDDADLVVRGLGAVEVYRNGDPITDWNGYVPLLLFFYVLDNPAVSRANICRAIWPDMTTDQSVNVFHVTKRRLHRAINAEVLVHENDTYRVNTDMTIKYDGVDFAESLLNARLLEGDEQFDIWQQATEMYRAPYLNGYDADWIKTRRRAFQDGYVNALIGMANAWKERDRSNVAINLYRQILETDVTRQDVHRELMKSYDELGRRGEAVAHYQQMEKQFADLDLAIEPETTQTYNEIAQE